MCPGFVKLRLPGKLATDRLRTWLGRREILAPTPVKPAEINSSATDSQGHWRGLVVVIREHQDWTLFEDLSGGLCALGHEDASRWLELGGDVYEAEYNDAIPFASMAIVEQGELVFDFFDDPSRPDLHRNRGTPPARIRTWVDVASLIDEDDAWVESPAQIWILEG
jgi:hypothetical protein